MAFRLRSPASATKGASDKSDTMHGAPRRCSASWRPGVAPAAPQRRHTRFAWTLRRLENRLTWPEPDGSGGRLGRRADLHSQRGRRRSTANGRVERSRRFHPDRAGRPRDCATCSRGAGRLVGPSEIDTRTAGERREGKGRASTGHEHAQRFHFPWPTGGAVLSPAAKKRAPKVLRRGGGRGRRGRLDARGMRWWGSLTRGPVSSRGPKPAEPPSRPSLASETRVTRSRSRWLVAGAGTGGTRTGRVPRHLRLSVAGGIFGGWNLGGWVGGGGGAPPEAALGAGARARFILL